MPTDTERSARPGILPNRSDARPSLRGAAHLSDLIQLGVPSPLLREQLATLTATLRQIATTNLASCSLDQGRLLLFRVSLRRQAQQAAALDRMLSHARTCPAAVQQLDELQHVIEQTMNEIGRQIDRLTRPN